jgi:hypothetical protein
MASTSRLFAHSVCLPGRLIPWARVPVGTGLVVVMASDGPVLGWGNPPKHQGGARPRLNTCISPAGPVGPARGDAKHLSRHKQLTRPVPALKRTPSKVRTTQAPLRPKNQPIIF